MRYSVVLFLFGALALLPAGSSSNAWGQTRASDLEINRRVRIKLQLSDGVPANRIVAWTRDGVVTLSGSVDSRPARRRAARVARSVRGVRSIVNNIAVATGRRSDRQIETAVEGALGRERELRLHHIEAWVYQGVVTLTGTVDTPAQSLRAGSVAGAIPGVHRVRNMIQAASQRARARLRRLRSR